VSGIQQLLLGGAPSGGYQIERSLRFNSADSAFLNRTPASAGNRDTWTYSTWIKRSVLSTNQTFFSARSDGNNYDYLSFNTSDQFSWAIVSGGSTVGRLITTQVFRDVSSWYHFLITYDSGNATGGNRMRLYVNGTEVIAFGTDTNPSINQDGNINNTIAHNIGRFGDGTEYCNYYQTETNFIDGQALTPSSFGQTNAQTGVWEPIAYTSTYGTNGFYLPMSAGTTFSGFFDGSNDYLSVASNAAWQYGTGDFTLEWWLFGTTSGSFSNQNLIGRYNVGASAFGMLQIDGTNIYWYYGNGAAYTFTLGSALNTNQWYHMAVSRSGTSLRFFLNGTQVGSTQTDSTNYSGTAEFRIINAHQTSATYFPGYISNVRVVKGTAVYTANFTPSTAPLTAITNTVLLTCQSSTFIDNSTNNFAITNNGGAITQLFSPFYFDATDDQSGNGNNWQPNNLDLTTTGVGADNLVDTPTSYGTDTGAGGEVRGNYCTANAVDLGSVAAPTNGNLAQTLSGTNGTGASGTFAVTSGKWYWEVTSNATTNAAQYVGVIRGALRSTAGPTTNPSGFYYGASGNNREDGTTVVYGTSWSTLGIDITIGVALDCDANTVVFYVNNASQGTRNLPSTTSGWKPQLGFNSSVGSATMNYNFGQRPFAYTAPSGFKALCTQNLETPTIGATSTTQANDYFNVVLYPGTGSSQSITGVGFQPDFVWIKEREVGTADHGLYDAVRGVQKQMESNTITAESTETTGLTAFNTDGFTVGALAQLNTNTDKYVAWNWNAGGSNQTISVGQYSTSPNVPSIASTVRASTTAGFSIVTYTGTGANATVGHGLGVAPSMIILKPRNAADNWPVWHGSFAVNEYVYLNLTNAKASLSTFMNSTLPSSTVISLGTWANTNTNTQTMVAYVFAAVAGYSAFGSYTGNGSTDGPFVFLGFRPRWILIKNSSATASWYIYDAVRNTFNVVDKLLYPNLSNAEDTYTFGDMLSNGFKIRSTDSGMNSNGNTIIYAAFAEFPFKFSLAR